MMNNRRRAALLMFSLLIAVACHPVQAQTNATDPLMMLPASDVVLFIDHSRILNEAVPKLLGTNLAPLARILEEGERFKVKTGINPRTISRIVAGVRFVNPDTITRNIDKKDLAVVIIVQGDFDANKFVAFMKQEGKERVREEKSGEQVIYVIEEPPEGNTPRQDTERGALTVLDANTVAIGDLAQVRATVAAKSGGPRLSPELLALVTRNSNALVSMAGNVPPAVGTNILPTSKAVAGDSEASKAFGKLFDALASIKRMYLSASLTDTGLEALLGARLGNTEQAQSLNDMLIGARQQYGVFIEDKLIRDLVNSMQITAQGDEIQLRAEVPQATIATLLNNASKKKPEDAVTSSHDTASPPPPKQRRKTTTRRSTRRKKG